MSTRIARGIPIALCLAVLHISPVTAAGQEKGKQQASDAKPGADKKMTKPDAAAPAAGTGKQKLKTQVAPGDQKSATGKPNAKPQPILDTTPIRAFTELSAAVDREIDAELRKANVPPSPVADDAEFLRRVTIDIIGRIPTLQEVIAFLADSDPHKRQRRINELLASPEYGRHFGGGVWRRLMAPPSDSGASVSPQFGPWLAEQFNRNRGWNEIVGDLITAEGSIEQPQTAFIMANAEGNQPQPNRLASATGRLFLGVQMHCAECHDHPFADWKQDEFWGTAAFFSRVLGNMEKGTGRFRVTLMESPPEGTPIKTGGPMMKTAPGGAIVIPTSAGDGAGRAVKPRFPKGESPALGDEGPYRRDFARWLTAPDNRFFATAAVNRLWAHFFARGLVNPIDDFRDDNAASHPKLLSLLSEEFVASGFNQKHVIRILCNTQAYQRTSRPVPENEKDATLFSRMAIKTMTPTALYDSLAGLTSVTQLKPTDLRRKGTPKEPRDVFAAQFTSPGDNSDPGQLTYGIPQFLRRMNADVFNTDSPLLNRLNASGMSRDEAIETLYLSTLSRRPTQQERELMSGYLDKRPSAEAGYAGVLWILLNSGEFVLNH